MRRARGRHLNPWENLCYGCGDEDTGNRIKEQAPGWCWVGCRPGTFRGQGSGRRQVTICDIEIGGAGEWSTPDGASSFGPAVAVEFTPIKDWLEIEAGVSPL